MVLQPKCDCRTLQGWEIGTNKALEETRSYFQARTQSGLFTEIAVTAPYYSWRAGPKSRNWFADKWYTCNCCGCLWEIVYPEFPAKGFVRKFNDGVYLERGY